MRLSAKKIPRQDFKNSNFLLKVSKGLLPHVNPPLTEKFPIY